MDHPKKTEPAGDIYLMSRCILRTEQLTIGYTGQGRSEGPFVVSEQINVGLCEGEIICLIGPNGAGKSTLIRTMAGLHSPLSGKVVLHQRDITSYKPKELAKCIGIVTTERVNIGMFTGSALVSLGRFPYTEWTGKLNEEDKRIVGESLALVGAESLAARNVGHLSDGERQKVMVARALAQDPQIIILDEPTAFLDLPRRIEIMGLLKRLTRETEKAILLSTHDLDLALQVADTIWLISEKGEITTGAPEDLVLSGAFEKNFAGPGVAFDRRHGTFLIHRSFRGEVSLFGDGLVRVWTKKALEREGYRVTSSPSAALSVECDNDGKIWTLVGGGRRTEYHTIYDLLRGVAAGFQEEENEGILRYNERE